MGINDSDDEGGAAGAGDEENLSPTDAKIQEVLNQKRHEVIGVLIDRVGSKNADFENCLNAHLILMELTENETLFPFLIETQQISKLITNACDIKNQNQAYAL